MFKKIKISKCDHCIIGEKEKKGEIKLLERNIGELRRGKETAKVLIVLSLYETDKFICFFETLLKKYHISDYVIVSGIDCSISNMKGYTKHDLYKYCSAVDLEKFKNLKVILTIGSGLLAITKTSDVEGWYEFKEFVFNQTYFYTGFNCERKIRVYPLPYLDEFIIFDSFERFFAEKQLGFVKNYVEI